MTQHDHQAERLEEVRKAANEAIAKLSAWEVAGRPVACGEMAEAMRLLLAVIDAK